jgi:predicted nicotinamide N-methyase
MPGYRTKQEPVAVRGELDLEIRSLLDRQQYSDPLGAAARLGISPASWPLFGLLWPSALRLAERVGARPVRDGERILEIGCGLALPSLVGHRRGAHVTASDCHPLAGDFLRTNLLLNALAPLRYRHGDWGADATAGAPPTRLPAPRVRGRFGLLIGSDLLYERDDHARLAGFIDRHALAASEVWIVDPDRGNRPAFTRQMARHGFAASEERLDCAASATAGAYKGRLLIYRRAGTSAEPAPPRPN